jgi:ATP-dependent Clp protease adaptor protein ClpS
MTTAFVPDTKIETNVLSEFSWQTILYNCDCHTFDDVIEQLMLAIKCTEQTASQYAMTVHTLGSVAVFKGPKEKCEQVADVLGSIGLNVKVVQ